MNEIFSYLGMILRNSMKTQHIHIRHSRIRKLQISIMNLHVIAWCLSSKQHD